MNERPHFFRKIYLAHFILERVAIGLCVRGELETEQTATYWPPVTLTIAAFLFSLCLTGGPEGPSPLLGVGSHCIELQLELQLQLIPTNSNCLNGRIPNYCLFKILKFSGPSILGMTSSTLQLHFLSGGLFIMTNVDCHILCARA